MDSFGVKIRNCSQSLRICSQYLYSIIKRKFVEVPVFKTVGAWINKILFSLSDMS